MRYTKSGLIKLNSKKRDFRSTGISLFYFHKNLMTLLYHLHAVVNNQNNWSVKLAFNAIR